MGSLGALLRRGRALKKWSLGEAADRIGCTKAHLHEMESGRSKNPEAMTLCRIEDAYGFTGNELLAAVRIS